MCLRNSHITYSRVFIIITFQLAEMVCLKQSIEYEGSDHHGGFVGSGGIFKTCSVSAGYQSGCLWIR